MNVEAVLDTVGYLRFPAREFVRTKQQTRN